MKRNAAEQAQYGARILDQAVKNMELNSSALMTSTCRKTCGVEVAMNAAYQQGSGSMKRT